MTVRGSALAAAASLLLTTTSACRRNRDAPVPPAGMIGAIYPAGRAFALEYCAPCHTSTGADPRRKDAHPAFTMDTFAEWQEAFGVLRGVLDRWSPDGKVMPPSDAPRQPSDAERRLILEWVTRGSPNTPDGRCPDGRPTCRPGF